MEKVLLKSIQLRERIKSNEYERLPESTKNKSVEQKESNIVDFIKNPILIKNDNKYVIKYCSDERIIARKYELVWYNRYRFGDD